MEGALHVGLTELTHLVLGICGKKNRQQLTIIDYLYKSAAVMNNNPQIDKYDHGYEYVSVMRNTGV